MTSGGVSRCKVAQVHVVVLQPFEIYEFSGFDRRHGAPDVPAAIKCHDRVDAALIQIESHETALVEPATYDTQEGKRHASKRSACTRLAKPFFVRCFWR
jgi:hypothetical protein